MKLVLHAGLHRAASSSLQSLLVRQRTKLQRQGILALERSVLGAAGNAPFRTLARPSGDSAEARRAAVETAGRRLDDLSSTYRCVVLSDENMLGPMPGKARRAFERLGFLSHCLAELSPRYGIEVLIVLRSHVEWLASLYRFAVARGDPRSFESFMGAIQPQSLMFAPVLDRLRSVLRPGVLTVVDFEAVRVDAGRGLILALASATETPRLAEAELPRVNVSPSPFLFDVIRILNARRICISPDVGSEFLPLAERLARSADDREAMAQVTELLARNAIRLPLPLRGRRRLRAARWLGRADKYGLFRPLARHDAERLVHESLSRAAEGRLAPVVPPALAKDLGRRFEDDRLAVAERYLPSWRERRDS